MPFFGEINSAISVFERVKRWWDGRKAPQSETVANRFVRLFESHGVHRNQIPRFFGGGITLSDLRDEAALLAKLDEATLDKACALFSVRREWLDGADDQPHPYHDFYGRLREFSHFLDTRLADNPRGELVGKLLIPNDVRRDVFSIIVLQEQIGSIGEKPIYRYHLLNNWVFQYWRSRAYLTACIAIAWKKRVHITGGVLSNDELEKLAYGRTLLGWAGEGIWMLGEKKWYPEDMTFDPGSFLNQLDPEPNNFGIRSALTLWLELDRQGLMDAGLEKKDMRRAFETELKQYEAS